jgi:hypothetical protein
MLGVPDPWNLSSTATVLYTDGELPASGRPAELVGATTRVIVAGRPGINFGADPRNPVGSDGAVTVSLIDDGDGNILNPKEGALGKILLNDPDGLFWGLNTNRLTASTTATSWVNMPAPSDGLYFIRNECVHGNYTSSTTGTPPTHNVTLTRARCGSIAQVHVLRPTDFSPGEDGKEDRIYATQRPNWDEEFYCAVYLFLLDHNGAIIDYVARLGIVAEEPTQRERPFYDVKVKFLEDRIASHKIGGPARQVTLQDRIIVTHLQGGRPQQVGVVMRPAAAAAFFNEPVGLRGSPNADPAVVTNLYARINGNLNGDPDITYQMKIAANGQDWVYRISSIGYFEYQPSEGGNNVKGVKINGTLLPDGYTFLSNIFATENAYKPWWDNQIATGYGSGFADGSLEASPPTVTLRLRIEKTVVQAFLTLAISNDGSTVSDHDNLIGGLGAGIPESFFSQGTPIGGGGPSVLVPGNTSAMLQLDQLLNPTNTYYFDLSQGVSLKDFLTNEFIASQLLMGPLQNGLLTLKSWVHEVPASVALEPVNRSVPAGTKLSQVKRLDLSAGIRTIDLLPSERQSVRYAGAANIKPEETQAVRFWRSGLNLSLAVMPDGDLSFLVRAFYKLFGGRPTVYEVAVSMEDYIRDGIEFGDAVSWSDPDVATPTGMGISGDFFVVGVDLDFDGGETRLKLLKNTLVSPVSAPATVPKVAPALNPSNHSAPSATEIDIDVLPVGHATFDPAVDFGGIFEDIKNNDRYVKLVSFDHAPAGALEQPGSVETHAKITQITVGGGGTVTMRLEVEPEYLRGNYPTINDLVKDNETRIVLPARQPAEVNLAGQLIEADPKAAPALQNYASFQPRNPMTGVTQTFKV